METIAGIALILLTLFAGTAIGMRANKNVRAFKEEEHEIFVGKKGN